MNILLLGASGKMGNLISLGFPEHKFIPIDLDHTINNFEQVDALIDFSTPVATMKYIPICLSKHIPCIIGTTSLSKKERNLLIDIARNNNTHLRLCTNFDPTFKSFLQCINNLKSVFNQIIIEEWHNRSKKDCPSGSAQTIAQTIKPLEPTIISHRCDYFVYKHQVTFINSFTEVRIIHEVRNKKIYLEGLKEAIDSISCPEVFEGL